VAAPIPDADEQSDALATSPLPPPWSVEQTGARFIVRDANGPVPAYVYFEEEPGPARRLTCSRATIHGARRDEALRVLPSVLPRYSSQVALLADTILAPWRHQAELR
jgi:hypothetical protein